MGLAAFNFRPYSFRRGGASHDYGTHFDISRTVWRGRWSDSRTARIYVPDGLARIVASRLSAAQATSIEQAKTFLLAWLHS
jgi:hypothetical protein